MAIDITRAWKDPEYRKSLTAEERASLPPNPTGEPPASEEELRKIVGGLGSTVTLGGPTRCRTKYPDCCYNSTIGPRLG